MYQTQNAPQPTNSLLIAFSLFFISYFEQLGICAQKTVHALMLIPVII